MVRLTPMTKSNFWFSIIMLIVAIGIFVIGSLETWGHIAVFSTAFGHWFWYLIMAVFLLFAWLLQILGHAMKRL